MLMATLFGKAPDYCKAPAKVIVHAPEIKERKNATDNADQRYLDVLEHGHKTAYELSVAIPRNIASVQRQLRRMEERGLVEIVGKVPNRANPAILWRKKCR